MRFRCRIFTSLGVLVGWCSLQWLGEHATLRAAHDVQRAGSRGFVATLVDVWCVVISVLVPVALSEAMMRAKSDSSFAFGTFLMSWY